MVRAPAARLALCGRQAGAAQWWGWVKPATEDVLETRYEAARDLARFFLLDHGRESRIGEALHEMRGDPYPELSALALDNELLLRSLADTPEILDRTDWELLGDVGRTTLTLLGETPETEQGTAYAG